MGKHRKPSPIHRQMSMAIPAGLCACLLASSAAPQVRPVSDTKAALPGGHAVTMTTTDTLVADNWMIRRSKAMPMKAPHIRHKRRHVETFNTRVLKAAESQLGVPYEWGGETPGVAFDCSGLVQYAYGRAGRWVPRVANDQFHFFRMVRKSEARPGDLVFFHDDSDPESYVYHVGIYVGGNDMMVVAPSSGEDVRIQNFDWAGDTVTFGTLDIH